MVAPLGLDDPESDAGNTVAQRAVRSRCIERDDPRPVVRERVRFTGAAKDARNLSRQRRTAGRRNRTQRLRLWLGNRPDAKVLWRRNSGKKFCEGLEGTNPWLTLRAHLLGAS